MKKINSYEELLVLRDRYTVKMRPSKNATRVIVGMATCGIAAGAGEVLNSINEKITELGLKDILVISAGCMGACHSEPTVEIIQKGKEAVLYGNIDADKARLIVDSHIVGGELVKELILEKTYETIS